MTRGLRTAAVWTRRTVTCTPPKAWASHTAPPPTCAWPLGSHLWPPGLMPGCALSLLVGFCCLSGQQYAKLCPSFYLSLTPGIVLEATRLDAGVRHFPLAT